MDTSWMLQLTLTILREIGAPIYIDIVIPLLLILLMVYHRKFLGKSQG